MAGELWAAAAEVAPCARCSSSASSLPGRSSAASSIQPAKRLDLFLDFDRGSRFRCPNCSAEDCAVHDTEDKEWRHLNFMYLHARVPRIRCERCGVRQVELPWARPGSGLTHFFEAFVMTLAAEMPVRAIADLVGEHDTGIWRLVQFPHGSSARARGVLGGPPRGRRRDQPPAKAAAAR